MSLFKTVSIAALMLALPVGAAIAQTAPAAPAAAPVANEAAPAAPVAPANGMAPANAVAPAAPAPAAGTEVAPPAPAETVATTTFKGEVGEVFGSRFTLKDGDTVKLVDPAGETSETVKVGETLTVVGEETPNGFHATEITRADGTKLTITAPQPPMPPAGGPAPAPGAAPGAPPAPGAAPGAPPAPPAGGPVAPPAPPADPEQSQGPQITTDEAAAKLAEWGLTNVKLDEVEGRHYSFDANDADGRAVDVDLFQDGTLKKFDIDGDQRASKADLTKLLPEGVRQALTDRGITDVHEFEVTPRHYKIEGYNDQGREIEIELEQSGRAGTISVDAPQPPADVQDIGQDEMTKKVEAAGYKVTNVERGPRHYDVTGTNAEGEQVKLHVELDGTVSREQLVR